MNLVYFARNSKIIILQLENMLGDELKNLGYHFNIELIRIKGEVQKEVILILQNLKEEVEYLEINSKKNIFIR